MRRTSNDSGFALVTTVVLVAMTLMLIATGLLLGRSDLILFRNLRDGTVTYYRARSALVRSAVEIPAGYGLDHVLVGPDGVRGTGDDGIAPASDALPGCEVTVRDDAADPDPNPGVDGNRRVRLTACCDGPSGARRALEGIVARERAPYVPAALLLETPDVGGAAPILLDGRDHRPSDAPSEPTGRGAGVPDAAALDFEAARPLPFNVRNAANAPIRLVAATSPIHRPSFETKLLGIAIPLLHALPNGVFLTGLMRTASSARGRVDGRGMFVIDGDLEVVAPSSFTGVIVINGGLRIGARGSLSVQGFLWVRGKAAASGIRADGPLSVVYSRDAVSEADRLFQLPRRARLRAEREVYEFRCGSAPRT